jgi:hypothetical protein
MTTPAHDDDIGCKSLGLAQDGFHGRVGVVDHDVHIRPSTRKRASRLFGCVLGTAVERIQ